MERFTLVIYYFRLQFSYANSQLLFFYETIEIFNAANNCKPITLKYGYQQLLSNRLHNLYLIYK